MSEDLKAKARFQFGVAAEEYATSEIHAKGASLTILISLVEPQRHWKMLDVATGAGHTALTFAPYVKQVIATDLTDAMIEKTAELATIRGLTNVETKIADAEALPFADATFDLVTCRLAHHHFPNPELALNEFNRILKPRGILGFTDNITVDDEEAAEYHNMYEKLRDPSHNSVYPLTGLVNQLKKAGFHILATQLTTKEFEFYEWADRQRVSKRNKVRLLQMMRNLPEALEPLFKPHWTDRTMYFSIEEAIIVAQNVS